MQNNHEILDLKVGDFFRYYFPVGIGLSKIKENKVKSIYEKELNKF